MKNLPERKSNRIKNYDYSQNGAYFITICTKNMECILSSIVGRGDPDTPSESNQQVGRGDLDTPSKSNQQVERGDLDTPQIILSDKGKNVEENILKMNEIYNDIKITKYIIMPNHIHLIINIQCVDNGVSGSPRPTKSNNMVSNHIGTLKRFTNKESNEDMWQTSFYDHIIRDEEDLYYHLQYIEENPKKWLMGKDEYYS